MRRLLLVVAALAFSATAAAQMYKWKDKNGHIQYGDTPPPGAATTQIHAPAAGTPAPPAAAKKPLSPEAAFEKRMKDREAAEQKAEKERAQAEQKRANCEQAQAQLRTLQSGIRISSINAAGERVVMDDAARATATQQAQKAVADWCN